MTSHLVGICILTAQHHNSQIPLLCLKNTLHLQFSGTKSLSGLTFYKEIACAHCPCSPVKDIHQHHGIYIYVCTHRVIACPLLHQHASTSFAWTPCYCTRCRAPTYPCMPCWSICNRQASLMRCLRPTSWHAHTIMRHTGVARLASALRCRCTGAGKPAEAFLLVKEECN